MSDPPEPGDHQDARDEHPGETQQDEQIKWHRFEYRTLNINGASTTLQHVAIVNGTVTIGDSGGQPIKVENTRPPLPRQPALSQARSTRGISQVVRAPRNRGGSQV